MPAPGRCRLLTRAESGSAVAHDDVQFFLRVDLVAQVFAFQHLTFIGDHLGDMSRVMTTIFRAVMVDLAQVHILTRIESQPGASG